MAVAGLEVSAGLADDLATLIVASPTACWSGSQVYQEWSAYEYVELFIAVGTGAIKGYST